MATKRYDPSLHRSGLFPNGAPPCKSCGTQPVYLAGRCGDCYAARSHKVPNVVFVGGQLLCTKCSRPVVRAGDYATIYLHA